MTLVQQENLKVINGSASLFDSTTDNTAIDGLSKSNINKKKGESLNSLITKGGVLCITSPIKNHAALIDNTIKTSSNPFTYIFVQETEEESRMLMNIPLHRI